MIGMMGDTPSARALYAALEAEVAKLVGKGEENPKGRMAREAGVPEQQGDRADDVALVGCLRCTRASGSCFHRGHGGRYCE